MIVSFIPGRVRIRNSSLKNSTAITRTMVMLRKLPGFISAESGSLTGSVLLRYDPAAIPAESTKEIYRYVKKAVPNLAQYFVSCSWKHNKVFNRVMAAALAVCMLSPAMGMLRLHKYSAFLFAGFSLKHVYDYRRRII